MLFTHAADHTACLQFMKYIYAYRTFLVFNVPLQILVCIIMVWLIRISILLEATLVSSNQFKFLYSYCYNNIIPLLNPTKMKWLSVIKFLKTVLYYNNLVKRGITEFQCIILNVLSTHEKNFIAVIIGCISIRHYDVW